MLTRCSIRVENRLLIACNGLRVDFDSFLELSGRVCLVALRFEGSCYLFPLLYMIIIAAVHNSRQYEVAVLQGNLTELTSSGSAAIWADDSLSGSRDGNQATFRIFFSHSHRF